MPAQIVETLYDLLADLAHRHRRGLARRPGWVGRVSGDPRHADHPVVQVEVRLKVVVGERPVVGDPVQRPDAEVRGVHAREVAAPVNRAAADGVVHQRRDGGVVVIDRVVLRLCPDVWVGAEVCQPVGLPILMGGRVRLGVHPVPLLQAHHVEAGVGEAPRKRPTRRAGPDYQGVHRTVVAAHLSVLLLVDANRNGNPLYYLSVPPLQ